MSFPIWTASIARFESNDFVLIAITDEDAATVNKFLADHPLRYPILLDPGGKRKGNFS